MGDHYPTCEKHMERNTSTCICEALSEHADLMVGAALADLRAKVEALPPHGAGERMFVWRDDVLSLIVEEAQP